MPDEASIAAFAATQHGPRPLPLFLDMLRSETAANPHQRTQALRGLAAYQRALRPPPPAPRPIVARAGRATLRTHGGTGPALIVVPSLINPPSIVDLSPGRSLTDHLARTHRVLVVDWGEPSPGDAAFDIAAHVERFLLPLIGAVGEPAALVGYCLGGTLALAAAALIDVPAVATIATPWHFGGYDDDTRRGLADLWAAAEPTCRSLGVVPMEVLQSAFWKADPARTIAKFADLADLTPGGAAARAFVTLEDWANGGAPLPYAAGRDLFETFVRDDAPGRGMWRVGGRTIEPTTIHAPTITFVSTTDRIVPAATTPSSGTCVRSDAGHVGMMVGRHARVGVWQPLTAWLKDHRPIA